VNHTNSSHTQSHHAAPSSYSTTLVVKLGTTLDSLDSISDRHSNTIDRTTVLSNTIDRTRCVTTLSYIRHRSFSLVRVDSTNYSLSLNALHSPRKLTPLTTRLNSLGVLGHSTTFSLLTLTRKTLRPSDYNCLLLSSPPLRYRLPPPRSPSLSLHDTSPVPTQALTSSVGLFTSVHFVTAKFCTLILTSTPTLFYGTLSPTRLQKPKILSSPKSAKSASGAKKAHHPKHLPLTTPHQSSTSQCHRISRSNTNTTRLSELSCTHRKLYPQSAHINTTLECDASFRPVASLGVTTPKRILPPRLTHTPPDSNPNSKNPNPDTDTNSDPDPNLNSYPNILETLQQTLNLDLHGKPLSCSTAKSGPDLLQWKVAEAEEIVRLILSGTLLHIAYHDIPVDRLRDIVYYNPVGKQKRNDDGTIKYRVRGTAGGNLLDVPCDVSPQTASLDVVKLLLHSTISDKKQWFTIDIKDFYLGTPLPETRYEYIRIERKKIPPASIAALNLEPLFHNGAVYFQIRNTCTASLKLVV
jgi:hypothetical protein